VREDIAANLEKKTVRVEDTLEGKKSTPEAKKSTLESKKSNLEDEKSTPQGSGTP
jgi:hypothetical protein